MIEFYSVMVMKNSRLNSSTLQVSRVIAEELELAEDESVTISAGLLRSRLRVRITNKSNWIIELSPSVLRAIRLPAAQRCGIAWADNAIMLGPVVGIMAETGKDMNKPFLGQSHFIKEVIKAGRGLGEICFGFNPYSINYHNRTIMGITYINGGWRKNVFPIPDVVYPREGGYSYTSLRVRKKLENMGCKFINPPLVGKWQTHKVLSSSLSVSQYIPDTRRVNSFRQIEQMLQKYGAVYLKPVTGSQGKNIIKVGREHSNYKYQYQINYRSREGTARNLKSLRQNLRGLMGRRSYIVQRRINLLQVNGNIADVRVLVQKDNTGYWTITGKAFRVGKRGSITSNISGGGSGQKIPAVLNRYFPDPMTRNRIIDEIDYLALEIAKEMEKNMPAIGEMGVDIGIDRNGRIWFIEANLKPARQVFVMIGEKNTRRMAVVKPLLYARYLAKFDLDG
ncbi:MAG: YheC/YheD family protein [Syntrophomonadaceae bacterium]|nr:YheC/YheD family protein [Syntrophomonadaceae bacterium]